jgi:hypothetical protein
MTDLDPEIWNNTTLGDAAHNERLDRLEKQQHEDRAARLENREPREVVVENTYPGWTPPTSERTGTVPSNYFPVHFADEQQNDVLTDSAPVDETAMGIAVSEENDTSEEEGETTDSIESPSSEEENTEEDTKWT